MPHAIQTGNMKRALRRASNRCQATGELPGQLVAVRIFSIQSTKPFTAGLTKSYEHAIPLLDGIVFLVETARLGVTYARGDGFIPLDAQDFVRSITASTDSPAEASKILAPYFEAVSRLP